VQLAISESLVWSANDLYQRLQVGQSLVLHRWLPLGHKDLQALLSSCGLLRPRLALNSQLYHQPGIFQACLSSATRHPPITALQRALEAPTDGGSAAGGGAVAAADVPVRIRLLAVDQLSTQISFQGDPFSRPRQVMQARFRPATLNLVAPLPVQSACCWLLPILLDAPPHLRSPMLAHLLRRDLAGGLMSSFIDLANFQVNTPVVGLPESPAAEGPRLKQIAQQTRTAAGNTINVQPVLPSCPPS